MQSALPASMSLEISQLNKGTASEIFHHVDVIHGLLLKARVPTRPYTAKAVSILATLPEEKQLNILTNLRHLKNILTMSEHELETISEVDLADKALGYFNFRLKDHDWKTTAHNEIIEIYNPQGIQLYRSLNFFETCGYSLLDLCVNEWFVLWERPKYIMEKMYEIVGKTLASGKSHSMSHIGSHLIRETFDDGVTQPFAPRTALVEFRNIFPAFNHVGEVIGFVVTSTGKLVSEGDDSLKMGFI